MATNERFPVAVFTRDNPCTKVHLHNCFYRLGEYVARPVVEAKAEIGENAPKYLIREGYVEMKLVGGVDYYVPTVMGDNWLRNGIQRYLTLHPDQEKDCKELPLGYTRQAKKPAAKLLRRAPATIPQAPANRILRRTR